jgi:hypothetical protein
VTAAFSGSARSRLANLECRFQSVQCFGCLAVGARGGRSLAGLCDFGGFASGRSRSAAGFNQAQLFVRIVAGCSPRAVRARIAGWGFPACGFRVLRVVCFGQCAKAYRRAPDFTASAVKVVLGFMGSRLTRRPTGRRGRHCGVNPTLPARRRLASLLAVIGCVGC